MPALHRLPRVAVVDSGVGLDVAGGINLCGGEDLIDVLGHGTVVALSILAQAPRIELFAVKIFDQQLHAPAGRLSAALAWCAEHQMDLVNLSVGWPETLVIHPAPGVTMVAPCGCHAGGAANLIEVEADLFHQGAPKQITPGMFRASPYPPPMPGRPAARDAVGVSYAVANVTGFLAAGLSERGMMPLGEPPR